MNILMLTNTYLPHVGGVARSVESFTAAYRKKGHRVLVVAPEFEGMPEDEVDVVRVPAVQDFQGSGFSLALPFAGLLSQRLDSFAPDIVHSHHPYLLGMTAMRIARYRNLPLVFTHHTLYEEYTHYIAEESPLFRRFVAELATVYANLCEQVFAPSQSMARLLRERGVLRPIEVIPTGVDIASFAKGDGDAFRRESGIPEDAFVVGHLGRLAPEKNVRFLAEAVAEFMKGDGRAHFLVAGDGPSAEAMGDAIDRAGVGRRARFVGIVRPPRLADAYHAMDVFAFASHTETQGMVLTEAMAAGVPVVGLDASGVRDVVSDQRNGRLIGAASSAADFAAAIAWVRRRTPDEIRALADGARATAEAFSMPRSAANALACYERVAATFKAEADDKQWDHLINLIKAEWEIVKGMAEAARFGLTAGEQENPTLR